jgi:hypothetical protein
MLHVFLQELSGDARDWGERDALVHAAMDKFRLTLRSRPDFDRGCYNLGTVFYTFAMALQGDAGAQGLFILSRGAGWGCGHHITAKGAGCSRMRHVLVGHGCKAASTTQITCPISTCMPLVTCPSRPQASMSPCQSPQVPLVLSHSKG